MDDRKPPAKEPNGGDSAEDGLSNARNTDIDVDELSVMFQNLASINCSLTEVFDMLANGSDDADEEVAVAYDSSPTPHPDGNSMLYEVLSILLSLTDECTAQMTDGEILSVAVDVCDELTAESGTDHATLDSFAERVQVRLGSLPEIAPRPPHSQVNDQSEFEISDGVASEASSSNTLNRPDSYRRNATIVIPRRLLATIATPRISREMRTSGRKRKGTGIYKCGNCRLPTADANHNCPFVRISREALYEVRHQLPREWQEILDTYSLLEEVQRERSNVSVGRDVDTDAGREMEDGKPSAKKSRKK